MPTSTLSTTATIAKCTCALACSFRPPDIKHKSMQVYTVVKFEQICDWIMDEDACPTFNATVLKIRRENAGTYRARNGTGDGLDGGASADASRRRRSH